MENNKQKIINIELSRKEREQLNNHANFLGIEEKELIKLSLLNADNFWLPEQKIHNKQIKKNNEANNEANYLKKNYKKRIVTQNFMRNKNTHKSMESKQAHQRQLERKINELRKKINFLVSSF